MRRLSSRITAGVVGITSVVVLIGALGAWFTVRSTLLRGLDQDLRARAERVQAPRADRPPPRPDGPSPRPDGPGMRFRDQRRWLQIVDPDGKDVIHGLPDELSLAGTELVPGIATTVHLADGHRARVIFKPLATPGWKAWVGLDLEPVAEELDRLGAVLTGLWLAATVLAWVAVALLRARLLRPLIDLTSAIERLGPEDLTARVPDAAGPEEVRGLVLRLNSLLDRLEEAFRREQTTIANIAHELRTPVTVLRTALEFRLLAPGSREEAAVLTDCFRTVERMQVIVSNLLFLAQLEAGRVPLVRDAADIAALVREQIAVWRDHAARRDQRIEADLPPSLVIPTAAGHLRQVIDNLLGNAVAHAPVGSAIRVALTGEAFTVENSVTGAIDSAQLGRVFYRADAARHDGDHAGLGLALCRRLLRLLGGDLVLQVADGRFTARAVFATAPVAG